MGVLFGAPVVRRERNNYGIKCYFCMSNQKDINSKNKHHVKYADVSSIIKTVLHGPDLPIPEPNVIMETSSDSESINTTDTLNLVHTSKNRATDCCH